MRPRDGVRNPSLPAKQNKARYWRALLFVGLNAKQGCLQGVVFWPLGYIFIDFDYFSMLLNRNVSRCVVKKCTKNAQFLSRVL